MDALLRQNILNALTTLAANSPVLTSPTASEKLYEIFVWSCAVSALRRLDAELECRDSDDNPTDTLIFRLGPGLIWSPTTTPGFLLVRYDGDEYELQNGIRVEGRSRVLHELDICLLDRAEAVRCRDNDVSPRASKVRFLAECKFYGESLPLHLGREFLGLCAECQLRVRTIISNESKPEIRSMMRPHRLTANFEVSPLTSARVDEFIGWLAVELKQVL